MIDTPDNEDKNDREHVHGGSRSHPWSDIKKRGEHRGEKFNEYSRNYFRVSNSVKNNVRVISIIVGIGDRGCNLTPRFCMLFVKQNF